MATICSWCKKRIGFANTTYTYETVGKNLYCICHECSEKVSSAKNGEITFDEIRTDKTEPELFNYLAGQIEFTDEMIQARKLRREQQQAKEEVQHTDRLYNDIHQIAGDLRFVKNYIIFTIIVGVVFGAVYLIAMLQ